MAASRRRFESFYIPSITTGEIMQLNEDTLYILGRPNFWCHAIAQRMRELGHEIPFKSEGEQAHVINLMLEHYECSGADWRTSFEAYLRQPNTISKEA